MMKGTGTFSRFVRKSWWQEFLQTLKYSLYVITHPFDGFWDLSHEKRGSIAAANFIVFMVLLTRILSLRYTSFMFMYVYWRNVNVFQQCLSILLPLTIWCITNWGLTTLFDGKGKLRDVYMTTAYALTPFVLIQLPMILLSNVITINEGAFYSVLNMISLLWSGGLIICGMMMIHDYTLKKTLLFTLISVLGILIVIFLMLLFFTLVSDGVGYFVSLYREIIFRVY